MPLRKQGTIVKVSAIALVTIGVATMPSTANAGVFSSLFAPKATPVVTPKPTATPKPVATPAPTATPKAAVAVASATPAPAATPAPTATPAPVAASTNVTSTSTPAGAACTQLPTTKAFQKVDGDTADYSVAPGGNFESGTSGWTLSSGAKIVSGNESLGVAAGNKSLQIPLGGSATSPSFCVDESNPHFRFAYKVDNASLSGFIAYVIYRDAAGKITNIELVSSKVLALAPSLWKATPNSPLATLLPLNATTKTASVQLKITSLSPTDFVGDTANAILGENAATAAVTTLGGAATNLVATISGAVSPITNIGITVDSVMVDPYRRG